MENEHKWKHECTNEMHSYLTRNMNYNIHKSKAQEISWSDEYWQIFGITCYIKFILPKNQYSKVHDNKEIIQCKKVGKNVKYQHV